MSFNIRYNNINDNENWWEHRKAEIVKTLNFYSPDLLGVQEGLNDQIKYLDSELVDYTYVGVGRDDGKLKGEYAAIFYKKKLFKLLGTKTYWLSETPETVSIGWDASMERIVTFAQFKDYRNGNILYVFNTHFDHIGKISRKKSAELILRIIKEEELEKKKIIVMGDLNSNPKELPIEILKTKLDDAYDKSIAQPYGPIGTFNGFDLNNKLNNRIDYIFTKNIDVLQYINIDDRRVNNLYLSDHFPVLIRID
jgi:endonuclease/exonuclease/phosphatase family metal-dependent hydrolase